MSTTATRPYVSGHCGIGKHEQCTGSYAGALCHCEHHQATAKPDLLRRAAWLIRARVKAATPGPWETAQTRDAEPLVTQAGRGFFGVVASPSYGSDDYGMADAEFIASWHPVVALAVADWLEVTARDVGKSSLAYHAALAVARAYLGETA